MSDLNKLYVADGSQIEADNRPDLKLIGSMSLLGPNGMPINLRGRKARGVLALLASSPRPVLRETLTGYLWSRSHREQAQASLRQSVYELQEALREVSSSLLQVERNYLKLQHNLIRIDSQTLKSATAARPEALELLTADLLEDLFGVDPAFDNWLEGERQRVSAHARAVAEAVLADQTEPTKRIIAAEYILKVDLSAKHAWRALVDGYLNTGRSDAAAEACERYRSAFEVSIDIESTYKIDVQPEGDKQGFDLQQIELLSTSSDLIARGKIGKLRLAVMHFRAFDHMSERLATGLMDEIRTALACFRGLSCFSPTGIAAEQHNLKSLGALDLDFIIDGSVQYSDIGIRIIVHLVDAKHYGEIIWSQKFDHDFEDILKIQNEVASQVVARIDPELILRGGIRVEQHENLTSTSIQCVLRAIPAIYRLERPAFFKAGETLASAVAQDPDNGAAHAWWAYWHLLLLGQGWADNLADAETRTWELAKRAIALDPGDARALTLAGHVQAFTHRRLEEAMTLHERALSINPSLPIAWLFSGLAHTYAGNHGEAIRRMYHAKQLSPLDPHGFFCDMGLTLSLSLSGDDQQATEYGRNAAEINPRFSSTFKAYLSALGFVGNQDTVNRTREHLLTLEPGFSLSSALRRSPLYRPEDRAKFIEGLRRSGLS